jgi:predicted RNase H-like HicB family nuclease
MRFNVVVRTDEDDYYVATVPELPGGHTQAKGPDDLMTRIKEAILRYLGIRFANLIYAIDL